MKASVTFFFASQLSLLNENVCHLLKNRFRFFFSRSVSLKNKMAGKIKSTYLLSCSSSNNWAWFQGKFKKISWHPAKPDELAHCVTNRYTYLIGVLSKQYNNLCIMSFASQSMLCSCSVVMYYVLYFYTNNSAKFVLIFRPKMCL